MESPSDTLPKQQLNFRKICLGAGIIIQFLLLSNLIWSCTTYFFCSKFLPTFSYMGSYDGHDRLFILALTILFTFLIFFFSYVHLQFYTYSSKLFKSILLASNVVIFICLIIIAIFDQVHTAHHGIKTELIHKYTVDVLMVASVVWLVFTFVLLKRVPNLRNVDFIQGYLFSGFAFLVLNLYCGHFAGSKYENSLVNGNSEAVFEWIVVSMCVFYPYVFSSAFPPTNFEVKITK